MTLISSLSALASAQVAAGDTILASEHNTLRTAYDNRWNALKDVVGDRENHWKSATEPGDLVDGKLWYDSGNNLLKLRRSSAWETLVGLTQTQTLTNKTLTALATGHSFATGGADTFKARGLTESNTTAVTLSANGVLMSYSLLANTLASDSQSVRVTGYGNHSGGVAILTVKFGVSGTTIHNDSVFSGTAWFVKILIVRISDVSADVIVSTCGGDTNSNSIFTSLTSDISFSQLQSLQFTLTSYSSGSITQEGMLVEPIN